MKGIRAKDPLLVLQKGINVGVEQGEYVVHDGRYAWGKVVVDEGGVVQDVFSFQDLQLVVKEKDWEELQNAIADVRATLVSSPQPESAAGKFLYQKVPQLLSQFVDTFKVKIPKGKRLDDQGLVDRIETLRTLLENLPVEEGDDRWVDKMTLLDTLQVHLSALERWLLADIEEQQATKGPIPTQEQKCRIVNKDAKRQIVTGVVLEPNVEDAQGEMETPEEIENAFLLWSEHFGAIGLGHKELANDKVVVVEKWIARTDFDLPGGKVKKGSWMLSVKVRDPDIWEAIEKGEITGFSIGGTASVEPT